MPLDLADTWISFILVLRRMSFCICSSFGTSRSAKNPSQNSQTLISPRLVFHLLTTSRLLPWTRTRLPPHSTSSKHGMTIYCIVAVISRGERWHCGGAQRYTDRPGRRDLGVRSFYFWIWACSSQLSFFRNVFSAASRTIISIKQYIWVLTGLIAIVWNNSVLNILLTNFKVL